MSKRILAALLIAILAFSLCACNPQQTHNENEVKISFVNNSGDDIYGIQIEYLVDRQRIGGISASADPDMTKPFGKNEKIYFGVPELFVAEGNSDIPFGMLVYIFLEDGHSVPIKFMWEWTAEYNTEYTFEVSGTEETTFSITKVGNNFDCTVTSWDDLPKELIE